MKRIAVISVCTIVFIAAVAFTAIYLNGQQQGNASDMGFINIDDKTNNLIAMIYSALAMLAGILFGSYYDRFTTLQRQQVERINIGIETKFIFSSLNFYLALAASPIVFGIVIIASKGVSLGPGLFLAFQNGFFWQNVIPKNNSPVPVPGQSTPKPADTVKKLSS